MAIPAGNIVEFAVQMETYGQVMLNTWTYKAVAWPTMVTAEQAAEAFWNNVKTSYRALASSDFTAAFKVIRCRDVTDPTGDYGVYGVPAGEQAGTRTPPTGDPAPPFLAMGVRLNVGSRVTRPGQKRFCFLYDSDITTGVVGTTYAGLVET